MKEAGHMVFPDSPWVEQLVAQSLAEDVGGGDVSTALAVPAPRRAEAVIVARRPGVIAGLPLVGLVYRRLSDAIAVETVVVDGAAVEAGGAVARLRGPAAALLTGERTALNFMQHLSGIATLTARYVAAVAGTRCRILDTRKTLPGYRALAKYAVRAGGGLNHRFGLYDRILLKDNHWAASAGGIAELVGRARRERPGMTLEVEVDSPAQFDAVLPLDVDWILLDNFTPAMAAWAVRRRDEAAARGAPAPRLEASGNLDLDTVRAQAEAGVDAVSIGRLTHSAPALDLGLDFEAGVGGTGSPRAGEGR